MTRYLGGSLAIRVKSLASSLKVGLMFSSIIQPEEKKWCLSMYRLMFYAYTSVVLWKKKQNRQLTFNHDHVDIYGTDVWLWQTFALLQQTGHFLWLHRGVWLCSKRHHFPHSHSCPGRHRGEDKILPANTLRWNLSSHSVPPTITPNVTLMSVSSKQDTLKCHPFYRSLH